MKNNDTLIILIAVWEFLIAALYICFFIAIGFASAFALSGFPFVSYYGFMSHMPMNLTAIFAAFLVISFIIVGISVSAGVGLLKGKEWGYVMAIIHSALSLLLVPIGTIIGILAIVYLASEQVRRRYETTE